MGSFRPSRKITISILVILALAAFIFGGLARSRYKFRKARGEWKDVTLHQLATTSLTNAQILEEVDQIRHPTLNLNFGWVHDRVILMTNNEYLVYAFWHGANNGAVDHLFLARGTDQKWYYSTYHFCTGAAALNGDDPAGSITEFASRYSLRKFDGKSDECLKHTWPPKR